MRISDWSSDVCSSDLHAARPRGGGIDAVEIGERRLGGGEALRGLEHRQRAGRGRLGLGRGPAVARTHQAQLGEAAIQHGARSEEHTSELQSLMRISYAVFCLKKKTIRN